MSQWYEEPLIDDRVRAYAVKHDLDMFALESSTLTHTTPKDKL